MSKNNNDIQVPDFMRNESAPMAQAPAAQPPMPERSAAVQQAQPAKPAKAPKAPKAAKAPMAAEQAMPSRERDDEERSSGNGLATGLMIAGIVLVVIGVVFTVVSIFMKAPVTTHTIHETVTVTQRVVESVDMPDENAEELSELGEEAAPANEEQPAEENAQNLPENPVPGNSADGEVPVEAENTENAEQTAEPEQEASMIGGIENPPETAPTEELRVEQVGEPETVVEESDEPGKSTLKTPFAVAGLAAMLIGAVLCIVSSVLNGNALKAANRKINKQRKELEKQSRIQNPTNEDLLANALKNIPVLERAPEPEEGIPAARPSAARTSVEPRVDPVAAINQMFASLLAKGGKETAQSMIQSNAFAGVGVDQDNSRTLYQAGHDAPYRVVSATKNWNCPFFLHTGVNRMYPNPFILEHRTISEFDATQCVLHAFDVVCDGQTVTAQNAEELCAGKRLLRVVGAELSDANVVVAKGRIEMG